MKAVALLFGFAIQAADLPTQSQVQEIFTAVSKLANLPVKKPVRVERMTRDQLRTSLDKRIKESVKPSEIRADELTLKWLGFAPAAFDLKKTTVDLVTEQAAAFYDYKKRKLVMLENPIGEFDTGILAHELAHALADQHFKIGKFMDDRAMTDDAAMARVAVVEGQAQWLMTAYELRERSKIELRDHPELLPQWKSTEADNDMRYPVLQKSPFYMRVTLLFPYWEGARFQQAVVARQGIDGIRRVFEAPPQSTREILHPDTYFDRGDARKLDVPAFTRKGFKPFSFGVLGELDHLVVFKLAHRDDAEDLASAWRAGAYRLLESKKQCCVVLYASEWKDEAAAEKAREAWERHSRDKSLKGRLSVMREGRVVRGIEQPLDESRK